MGTIQIKNINGNEYAYEFISYRDKETKKIKKKCTYLGKVVDKEKKIFQKKKDSKKFKEKLLDFGDSYVILEFLKSVPFYEALKKTFSSDLEVALSLILYKILNDKAMQYAEIWQSGNYVNEMLKDVDLCSQKISEFLKKMGKESIHRKFFKNYLSNLGEKKISTLIDSTGLPNHIDFSLNEWSNHNGDLKEETRLLYVIDRNTNMPTYFRFMAGNIVDVSTLINTVEEIKQYNVEIDYSITDAGYYSEENIKMLYDEGISFLTRLPSNRKLYKDLIKKYAKVVEKSGQIVVYGNRTLRIKKVKTKLYEHNGYAYIIFDIKRYADEANKFIISAKADGLSDEEISNELLNKGKLIMLSSENINEDEVISLYYTRQKVENIFGVLKSELNVLPLRIHNKETFRGYMLISFIALIVELLIDQKLNKKFTLDEFFMLTRNLSCKVFEKVILVDEPNKKVKEIFELLDITFKRKLPR